MCLPQFFKKIYITVFQSTGIFLLFKLIPKHFIHFDVVVNGIIFLISLFSIFLFLYTNTTDS